MQTASSRPQLEAWHVARLRACRGGWRPGPAAHRVLLLTCRPAGPRQPRHSSAAAHAAGQQAADGSSQWASSAGSSPAHRVRRALGLDYGRRTVGLAVSTMGLAPRPLEGLPGPAAHEMLATAAAVLEVARQESCDAIVVGLPVTQAGALHRRDTDSQQGRRCRNFASNLASVAASAAVPVFLADEQGSTLEAKQALASSGSRRSTFAKRKDSVAAAVILGNFFEDPGAALLVKPWRPPGSGKKHGKHPGQQHQQRQQQQQRAEQQQQRQQQHRAEQQQQQQLSSEVQVAPSAALAGGGEQLALEASDSG